MGKKSQDDPKIKELMKNSLQKDLKKFSEDCEEVLSDHELIKDPHFLDTFAQDIKVLDEDTFLFDTNPSAQMIHYYLSTPLGAPFVFEKTLVEAAALFNHQDPMNSDLHNLLDAMIHFSEQKNNPIVILFHSIEEYLEAENS